MAILLLHGRFFFFAEVDVACQSLRRLLLMLLGGGARYVKQWCTSHTSDFRLFASRECRRLLIEKEFRTARWWSTKRESTRRTHSRRRRAFRGPLQVSPVTGSCTIHGRWCLPRVGLHHSRGLLCSAVQHPFLGIQLVCTRLSRRRHSRLPRDLTWLAKVIWRC